MLNEIRLYSLVLCCLLMTAGAVSSQTMRWAVRPTSAHIENYGQLLKVRKGGKCGLMDYKSQEVIPVAYDSITSFTNGYALALNYGVQGMKIEGIITEGSDEMVIVADDVFSTDYMWFSEGLMPVKSATGYGYMSPRGNVTIPCVLEEAHPFSEGWASVKMDGKAYYIDRQMDYLSVEAGYGDLVFASTFSGGRAVVFSRNMKGYVIDLNGRTIGAYRNKGNVVVNDYDYSVGDKMTDLSEQTDKQPVDPRFSVFLLQGRYGYKCGDQVVLPAQFDRAEQVRGGFARVTLHGQQGVLQVVEGGVTAALESPTLDVVAGQQVSGHVKVNVPDALKDDVLRLKVATADGKEMIVQTATATGTTRDFVIHSIQTPTDNATERCVLEVWCENLLLCRQDAGIIYKLTKAVAPVPLCPANLALTSIKAKRQRANRFDVFFINVGVSNDGELAGKARLTLFVNGKAVDKKNINVAPKRRATVEFSVPNVKQKFIAKVKASFDNGVGGKSQDSVIEFEPFY